MMRNPLLPDVEQFLQLAWAGAQRQVMARAALGFGRRGYGGAPAPALVPDEPEAALTEPAGMTPAGRVPTPRPEEGEFLAVARSTLAQLVRDREYRKALHWPSPFEEPGLSGGDTTGAGDAAIALSLPEPEGMDPAVAAWFTANQARPAPSKPPWSDQVPPGVAAWYSVSPAGGYPVRGAAMPEAAHVTLASFQVSGNEYEVSGSEYQASGSEYQVSGSEYQVSGNEYQVSGSEYQVSGNEYQVSGSEYQASGSEYQASGSGIQVPKSDSRGSAIVRQVHASELLTPARRFQVPTGDLRAPASDLQAPATDLQAPATDLQVPATDLQAPATDLQAPATDLQAPATDVQAPAIDLQASATGLRLSAGAFQSPASVLQVPALAVQARAGHPQVPVNGVQAGPAAMPQGPPPVTIAQLRALIAEILLTDGLRHGLFMKEG